MTNNLSYERLENGYQYVVVTNKEQCTRCLEELELNGYVGGYNPYYTEVQEGTEILISLDDEKNIYWDTKEGYSDIDIGIITEVIYYL